MDWRAPWSPDAHVPVPSGCTQTGYQGAPNPHSSLCLAAHPSKRMTGSEEFYSRTKESMIPAMLEIQGWQDVQLL